MSFTENIPVIQKGLNMSFPKADSCLAFHFSTMKYLGKKLKTQTMVVTTESNSVVEKIKKRRLYREYKK